MDILCDKWGNLGLLWLRKQSGTSPKEKAGDLIPRIPLLHIKVPLGKILNPKLPQIASDGCFIALDRTCCIPPDEQFMVGTSHCHQCMSMCVYGGM